MSTTEEADAPASETFGSSGAAVWTLGAASTLAAVLSRALAPSLLGVWEGADHIIAAVTLASALTAQLVAVGCAFVIVALVLETVKSELPQYARAFAVGVGMLILLALSISAVNQHLPSKSRLVVAGAAALLVLVFVRLSARIYTLRAASLALGGVAVAGLVRIACVATASHAIDVASAPWATAARSLATLHWVIDAAAIGLVLAVLTTHPRAQSRLRKPRWTALGTVLVLPLFFSLGVAFGADPERTGIVALLSNIAHHNRVLPAPFLPESLRVYVEVLRWVAAAAVLFVIPRSRWMAGALALALFSRSTLEVPLCAAAAVVAALAIALHPGPSAAHDTTLTSH